jgi:hypothetical protein
LKRKILSVLFALVLAVALVAGVFAMTPSVGQADPDPGVTMQLAVCLDGSGSISSADFTTMKGGLAAAVADPLVLPQDGSVELTVVQFAGSGAVVEVSPTVIDSQITADSVASLINGITKLNGQTPMAEGIEVATAAITGSLHFKTAGWQVINISTDGAPYFPSVPDYLAVTIAARDDAVAAGIDEVDAEAIGPSPDITWMQSQLVWPSPGVVAPPYPPRPPDPSFCGFVCEVTGFSEYAAAIREKLERVTTPSERYVYSVKFLCGEGSESFGVEPANYATAINIHNFLDEEVVLQKQAVIANREGEPMGRVSNTYNLTLVPGMAVEVDCVDIYGLLGLSYYKHFLWWKYPCPAQSFIKGFVVIESEKPLNIEAVYTAKTCWGLSLDVKHISPVVSP